MKHAMHFILICFGILLVFGISNFFNPRNCSDFWGSQSRAQARYDNNPKKFHDLDRDRDGVACEVLLNSR